MCGIVGYIGEKQASPILLEGLKRLEYRGYDSAGVAVLSGKALARTRAEGKLANLATQLKSAPIAGTIGIGHTRWATHGAPTKNNAHPHATDQVAVVHNGIIENFLELRTELEAAGFAFQTDTDTETIPILITHFLNQGKSPQEAVAAALKKLEGAFALGILFRDHPDLLIAARRGSPLAIGYGEGEMFLGSDALALSPFTQRVSYLQEGDWAVLKQDGVTVYDSAGAKAEREIKISAHTGDSVGKGNFRHYMEKEIFEQPVVIGETLNSFYHPLSGAISIPDLPLDPKKIARIHLIACGTSYYAGMVAKYWIEELARIPVELDIASEFRYRAPVFGDGGLALLISQSGETADTLASMRFAKEHGQKTLALVNAPESSMAREADLTLFTHAGPEIGVASTKAFTTQLTALACLALSLAGARCTVPQEKLAAWSHALAEVPARAAEILQYGSELASIAEELLMPAIHALFVGRGPCFPIALEGALKLKEISYIHAEGYAAGELKHGPIALIDEDMPVIALAPSNLLFEKTASNLQEIAARGGKILLITDEAGAKEAGSIARRKLVIPAIHPFVAPILYALPVQLLAYHTAVLKGTDVDQPRNLAKSVTVE